MTNPTKFPISPAFKAHYTARTGFSVEDPDRRVPIRGHDLAQVLTGKSPGRVGRADLLLADRGRAKDKDRARALTWLSPLAGLFGWPDQARAHDHHPPLHVVRDIVTEGNWADWLASLPAYVSEVDLNQPIFSLALGGTLLMTQIIGIRQRHALLNSVAIPAASPQTDLFPDTMPPEAEDAEGPDVIFSWESDAATRQGKVREENQDAVLILRFDDGSVVLIVCDGAGGVEGGREASQTSVEAIGAELRQIWEESGRLELLDLKQAISEARQTATEKQLDGVTTALVVLLDQDKMSYATLGDGAVAVVWPDGMVGQVQIPHHTAGLPSNIINAYIGHDCNVPPRVGSLQLEPGAIVMAMSDGASDLFPFEDFALSRDEYASLDGLADHLLGTLEEARDPDTGGWLHSDNLTLAMARLQAGGNNDETH